MARETIVSSMTDVSVESIDYVPDPERRDYQQYIDVQFSNGATVRHAIEEDGSYFEEVQRGETRDGKVLGTDVDPEQLPDIVDEWIQGTLEAIEDGETRRWDAV